MLGKRSAKQSFEVGLNEGASSLASLCVSKDSKWLSLKKVFFFFNYFYTHTRAHTHTHTRHLYFPTWANTVCFRVTYFSNNKLYQWGMWGRFLWTLTAPLKESRGCAAGDYGWIMNRSFFTMHETTFDMWPVMLHACENGHALLQWQGGFNTIPVKMFINMRFSVKTP